MSKLTSQTWRVILRVVIAVATALLGAAGAAQAMN